MFKLVTCQIVAGAVVATAASATPLGHKSFSAIGRAVIGNAIAHGIPAQAVIGMRNGQSLFRQFSGTTALDGGSPVNEETVFPVFSLSKLFATTLLLQLVEQGRLDLAAPASRYIDILPLSWHDITVEQFLNHVSGVPEYFDQNDLTKPFPLSRRAALEHLTNKPFTDPPGTRTRYTQTNFLVIGAILESVTGQQYGDLVRDRIISPLGLKNTWLGPDGLPHGRLVADYRGEDGRIVPEIPLGWPAYSQTHTSLYCTASDMATFLSAVANGRFVSRQSLLRFWRPYRFPGGSSGYFASGWEYGESGAWHEVGHDGGAKLRVRILFRDGLKEHFVIVYLANGSRDNVWSRTLIETVQQIVLSR